MVVTKRGLNPLPSAVYADALPNELFVNCVWALREWMREKGARPSDETGFFPLGSCVLGLVEWTHVVGETGLEPVSAAEVCGRRSSLELFPKAEKPETRKAARWGGFRTRRCLPNLQPSSVFASMFMFVM